MVLYSDSVWKSVVELPKVLTVNYMRLFLTQEEEIN
jgi:hypothetical protein